ncbi:hypothetical protein ATO6_15700 [Oceanicola sp. 22II-s10i]|uniref:hypothetical protein n=1 Tax=Oceanicola sp. 22II-s10i TaxID=1317116 RepID=UPI000B51EFF7|nr:hypothetical protein [Oceanicola sp. 22II-s10i]OWU83864.1 hypothetical protein ATO6_15700 [Oceanicola sp. 22II-s10i]
MTFTKFLATVSTAALLATPIAAQNAPDTNPAPDTGASAPSAGSQTAENDAVQSGDQDPMPTTFETQVFETADSMNAVLAGQTMDAANPWVGKMVKLNDGNDAGTISEVYVDGAGSATAKVEINEALGVNAQEMLLSLGAGNIEGDEIELAMNKEQFIEQAAMTVGVEPGAEKSVDN